MKLLAQIRFILKTHHHQYRNQMVLTSFYIKLCVSNNIVFHLHIFFMFCYHISSYSLRVQLFKECEENYYSPLCSTKCLPSTLDQYTCNKYTGDKICNPGQYSVICISFSRPENLISTCIKSAKKEAQQINFGTSFWILQLPTI